MERSWVKEGIPLLDVIQPGDETAVFKVLLNEEGKTGTELIETLCTIHDALEEYQRFTYTGLVDEKRIDSYFYPYVKISMKSYLKLLMAKEYIKLQQFKEAQQLKDSLIENEAFSELQRFQFEGYWERFVVKLS